MSTQTLPTPEELLSDPCTPFWAQDVIRTALAKDCVDAANTLEVLAKSFSVRASNMLAADIAQAPATPAAFVNVPSAGLSNIFALFQHAIAEKLKWPKVRLQTLDGRTVVLKINGSQSKYQGQIAVADDRPFGSGSYFGRIDQSGKYFPSRDNCKSVEQLLARLAANPAEVASEYGKLTGNCTFCGLKLTDEKSTAVGYGPICAEHFGLMWGAK